MDCQKSATNFSLIISQQLLFNYCSHNSKWKLKQLLMEFQRQMLTTLASLTNIILHSKETTSTEQTHLGPTFLDQLTEQKTEPFFTKLSQATFCTKEKKFRLFN